ncbi:MAG: hypothetical protein LBG73_01250 [Spirochaetaceae bacterium]|jgi:hypothetical protein|nr:hypothetical protein [Spirochaetaceae bacterium]
MKKLLWGFCFMILSAATLVSQQKIAIDKAIQDAQKRIERELGVNTRIIVFNFSAPTETLSEYVLEQLTNNLINGKKLIVIERKDLNLIRKEMDYQYSGDVSDEEMQAMGKQYGAQSIVSGRFDAVLYGFSIKVINVQTAVVEASYHSEIKKDAKLDLLLGLTEKDKQEEEQRKAEESKRKAEEDRRKEAERRQRDLERRQFAAPRDTAFILGVRGGLTFMFNELNDGYAKNFEKAETSHLGGELSFYFGSNSRKTLLGFQMEGNLVFNNGMSLTGSSSSDDLKFSYMSLDVPLLLRMGIGGISLFAGPYISIPLTPLTIGDNSSEKDYDIEKTINFMSSYGILGGITIGIQVGPGHIVLDGRYMYDFNEICILNDRALFRRHGLNLTIGYEFWL